MSNAEVYASVFARITEQLKAGVVPWVKPWGDSDEQPCNAVTGRPYSGGNVLVLWERQATLGYARSRWVTFKQALAAGCIVRKGEKGTAVYFMKVAEKKPKTADDDPERFFFARSFTVFNVAQLDETVPGSLDALSPPLTPRPAFVRHEAAALTIAATGATINHGGGRACYSPLLDTITLPMPESFDAPDAYYGTAFHELTHWTGHQSRLDRQIKNGFGNPEYAFEELVAELGAAFLSARHGLDTETQSAAYLHCWLKGLADKPEMLARASSLAQKAANFIAKQEAEPVTA